MKPNQRDPRVDRLMEGLAPPYPPPDLRSKVLADARRRIFSDTVPDLWSWLWNHRWLRLAWAASLVLLLAGHVLLTSSTVGVQRRIEPTLVAENRVDEYFVEMLRPVRISDNVQPIVGFVAATSGLTDLDLEGNSL